MLGIRPSLPGGTSTGMPYVAAPVAMLFCGIMAEPFPTPEIAAKGSEDPVAVEVAAAVEVVPTDVPFVPVPGLTG